MEDQLTLVKPAEELKNAYLSFYREWLESDERMVPWVISRDPSDFSEMVNWLEENESGRNLPEGWVPASTRWLVTREGEIVGAVNIRHRLTESLLQSGGHIGYGIRPSARGNGYATQLLKLSLEICRELGMERVLLCCDEDNVASERVIRKNGGVPDASFVEENGNVVKRFWITL